MKAPPGEPRQHRVGGALVEVLLVVGVVVVLLVGLVDVELLVVDVEVPSGGHVSCTSVTLSVLTALAKNAP